MPNIEIHGLDIKDTHEFGRRIFGLFKDKPYINEMVVTVVYDRVINVTGFSQPFIRLVNSGQEHIEEIIEALKTLSIDIEHLELKVFIPRMIR